MFDRVGFFHFGHGHDDPIGSLRAALSDAGDVSDSLIVLPEAFNIGMQYRHNGGTPDCSPRVLGHLRSIARACRIGFVAGLVIDDAVGVTPPYSSAYYIDRGASRLICHKGERDDRHGVTYTAFGRDGCDIDNPIEHNEACIAAMVCMDIQEHAQRCEALASKTASSSQPIRVFCVPAHMDAGWWPGLKKNDQLRCSIHREGLRVVVANSNPCGRSSFLTDPSGVVVDEAFNEANKAVLAPVGPPR